MLMLISPAKTLDESRMKRQVQSTQPAFSHKAAELVALLRQQSVEEIASLMSVSDKIAALNVARYRNFSLPLSEENAKAAIFSFKGDVYLPIDVDNYDDERLAFLNKHVRILSGLYGLLKPLDYLYPYRLEMGTKLTNAKGKHLYDFWGSLLTDRLNDELATHEQPYILNLASQEYAKAVHFEKLRYPSIHVEFKEQHGSGYRIVGIHAKKARGMMVDYLASQQTQAIDAIKAFNRENYQFNQQLSDESMLVFTRG